MFWVIPSVLGRCESSAVVQGLTPSDNELEGVCVKYQPALLLGTSQLTEEIKLTIIARDMAITV